MADGTLNLYTLGNSSPSANGVVQVISSISVKTDFSFTLSFRGVTICLDNSILKDISSELDSGKRNVFL